MRPRLALALIASLALTAFAPAPFPRRDRGSSSDGVAVVQLQGTWRVTKLQTTAANRAPGQTHNVNQEIEVVNDRWTFINLAAKANRVPYTISIDHKEAPAQLNFYSGDNRARPYGTGIIRRRGDTVEVLYSWGSPRAASFDNPPSGHWLMTIQRKR